MREKEELTKELNLVKTKFGRTQRVERAKFLEFYKVIQELREENDRLKATPPTTTPHAEEPVTNEQLQRLKNESEKQAQRIREQREFIEELMNSKNKLMENLSSEVKRNAALSKENAVLHDTIRQQLSFIENSSHGRQHQ